MTTLATKRSILGVLVAVSLAGCGENSLLGPQPDIHPPRPTEGAPIEFREDAATYGVRHRVYLRSVKIEETTLRIDISYGGGCRDHAFAAVAPLEFSGSDPAELALYLLHDGTDDRCAALIFAQLAFDVTKAIERYESTYGVRETFLLRLHLPGEESPILVPVPLDIRAD